MCNFAIKTLFSAVCSLFLISLISCEDVFENNISDRNIVVVSPISGDTIKTRNVVFNWKEVVGADKYRLQINESRKGILLDTLVESTIYTFGLETGNYTWRVRGENFAYKSEYIFPVAFRVEAIDDLTTQKVTLTSPSDKIFLNSAAGIIVSWDKLKYALSYTLVIDKKKTSGTKTLGQVTGITEGSAVIDATYLDEDAEYIWKVKAVGETSESIFFAHSIFLDTQVPVTPVQSAPVTDSKLQLGTINFNWVKVTDIGAIQSPVLSVLEIASDAAFTVPIKKYEVGTNNQSHTFDSAGRYFWRIKNKDQAGNESPYSEVRNFTIE